MLILGLYFAYISLIQDFLKIFETILPYISLLRRLYFAYIIILSRKTELIFRLYYHFVKKFWAYISLILSFCQENPSLYFAYIIILSRKTVLIFRLYSLILRLYFAYTPLILRLYFAYISLIRHELSQQKRNSIYHTLFVVPPSVFFFATSKCGTFWCAISLFLSHNKQLCN